MPKTSTVLIGIVLLLLSLGIVMLASASSVKALASVQDPQFFLKKQLAWLIVSLVVGAGLLMFDYHWWQKLAIPLCGVAILLLLLVFVPGLGREIGGSRRWLHFGPLSLQPSELGKFATIVGMAAWVMRAGRKIENLKEGLLIPLAGLGVMVGLMFLEPDYGTTILTAVAGMLVLFAGGARMLYLSLASLGGGALFLMAVMANPVRRGRVLAFIMPDQFPNTAYHLAQSKIAFIKGGLFGVGLGESMQKQYYLPEAHNDFILAIIGEELGLIGTGVVVALFLGLLICGLRISLKARDSFGKLLAFGLTMTLVLQAAINVGVVTGCLPTKGLPLPFISYGGSSMMTSIAIIAVLLNIASHNEGLHPDDHTKVIKNKMQRF